MRIKYIIKKIIGVDNIHSCKAYFKYLSSLSYSVKYEDRFQICSDKVRNIAHIEQKNSHVFCGYFDISPDSSFDSNSILVHVLDKSAAAGADHINIACADIKTGEIKILTASNAWCWQMGARLRWGKEKGIIYFNDFISGHYCCRKFDINADKDIEMIPFALYDISADEQVGVSINFSRLQRLRPGYGYSNKPDSSEGVVSPSDDGLFVIDMQKFTSSLLISYSQLDKLVPANNKGECYINHVSISPRRKNIMFFYIWCTESLPGWKATLCVINFKSRKFYCLESEDQVSHYDWLDDDTLLITGMVNGTRERFYRYYYIDKGLKESINDEHLKQDGHPVFSRISDRFYSDTYPDKHYRQSFFQYENNIYTKLADLYHNPRMFEEKRCDLHPHYFQTKEAVAVDTTYSGNKRSIIVFDIE